jgi:hypothetical protein
LEDSPAKSHADGSWRETCAGFAKRLNSRGPTRSGGLLMTAHKAMITPYVLSFSLLRGALIYMRVHGKLKLEHARKLHRSHSDLEQDEMTLAAVMRKLRRNLRRGVNQFQIAQERDEILQDWLNIVLDRGLKRDSFSPALVSFGR